MAQFITEEWLRSHHSLSQGTELHLPADARMTPSARALVYEKHLQVKYYDQAGRLFVDTPVTSSDQQTAPGETPVAATEALPQEQEVERKQVHGLTGETDYTKAHCQLCHQEVQNKTATMTHLDREWMVAKSDPRLQFRARLDSTIACAVWLQTELSGEVQPWLADIRSVLGNIMRADALSEPLAAYAIAGLNEQTLHRLSHSPLTLLQHDHIVPAAEHGRRVALLNLLRTQIRECEISAAQTFIDRNYQLQRPDLLQGLNRLSSAVYVLMLLCLRQEKEAAWPGGSLQNCE
ncbi:MAG: ethanolamine utilization cob(I)yrinic acid a,c-diamide adenosyltransferase EutT [Enterobacteriaceae bacterium]